MTFHDNLCMHSQIYLVQETKRTCADYPLLTLGNVEADVQAIGFVGGLLLAFLRCDGRLRQPMDAGPSA